MQLVPQRIGASKSLDDAAQLLSSVHQALLHDRPPTIDGPLYFQAIKSLRVSLGKPHECYSAETLAATATLYFLEAIFGSDWNFIHHAGGVARMLEIRGPLKAEAGFESLLVGRLRSIAVSVMVLFRFSSTENYKVSRAVQMGVPCFLADEPWRSTIENARPQSLVFDLYRRLLLLMVDWSEFAIQVRKFRVGGLSEEAVFRLRLRILQAQTSINALGVAIDEHASKGQVEEVVSIRQDPFSDTVFEFKDFYFSVVLVLHANYALAIHRMLIVLSSEEITQGDTASVSDLVNRICKSYEYAWKRRPFGSPQIMGPLVIAYSVAETEAMQTWILKALNELDSNPNPEQPKYPAESISYMADVMTGLNPPFLPPQP